MTDQISTNRLLMRRWREEDREPFAAINANLQVNEFLPGPLTRDQSDALIDRIEAHFQQHGFGLWAVEVVGGPSLIGFVGLAVPRFEAAFTPCVEVGWRLSPSVWGYGYATEAAGAALNCGFNEHRLEEILSFTVPENMRSRKVMERIGMTRDPAGDFDHPSLPVGHRLRRHVLYRLRRQDHLAADCC